MKTLNDLPEYLNHDMIQVEKKLLKQQVADWIKQDIKDWNAPGGLFQSQIINRWKKRFNLNESDLQ